MHISVLTRAHRILNGIPRYRKLLTDAQDAPNWLKEQSLLPNEVLIGVFENIPGQSNSTIVVTSHRLGVCRHACMDWVAYDSIGQVKGVDNKQASELKVTTNDGREFILPIVPDNKKFNDVFEWMRFINRVLEDRRKLHGADP